MNRNRLAMSSIAALALMLVGGAPTRASAQIYSQDSRMTRLEGDRFETMRSLAHYLDDGVQFTLEEATDMLGNSHNGRDRAFLDALNDLAQRTDSFHERMDTYATNPWDVDSEVRVLLIQARRVNSRMRRITALRDLYDDWSAVVDDVNRMQRLLAGQDVEVPPAHAEWNGRDMGDHDHGDQGHGAPPRTNGDYRTTYISGRDLDELRQLSHDLDVQARRALAAAEREQGGAYGPGAGMLADLRHFVSQTSSLHDRTDSDRLDPRDFGPVVNHLLEDARAADRSMRQARVFGDAWDDWQQAIRTLERMDAIVRG